jgi:hypothetical protein
VKITLDKSSRKNKTHLITTALVLFPLDLAGFKIMKQEKGALQNYYAIHTFPKFLNYNINIIDSKKL